MLNELITCLDVNFH